MYPVIIILFALIAFIIGGFLCAKPLQAIELQRRFYERINWRIEPVSMQKEARNTRLMGLLLVIIALAITACALMR